MARVQVRGSAAWKPWPTEAIPKATAPTTVSIRAVRIASNRVCSSQTAIRRDTSRVTRAPASGAGESPRASR